MALSGRSALSLFRLVMFFTRVSRIHWAFCSTKRSACSKLAVKGMLTITVPLLRTRRCSCFTFLRTSSYWMPSTLRSWAHGFAATSGLAPHQAAKGQLCQHHGGKQQHAAGRFPEGKVLVQQQPAAQGAEYAFQTHDQAGHRGVQVPLT